MLNLKKDYLRLLGAISSLGIELGVSIAVGYFFGSYLDKLFNTGKVLTIIFIILGIASAFKHLYQINKEVQKDLQNHKLDDIFIEEDKDGDK